MERNASWRPQECCVALKLKAVRSFQSERKRIDIGSRVRTRRICGFPSYEAVEALYHQSGCLLRMGRIAPAEASIRRAISVMDKIDKLSDYEKSDYLATLASVLEGMGRDSEAVEMRNRANRLYEDAKKQSENQD